MNIEIGVPHFGAEIANLVVAINASDTEGTAFPLAHVVIAVETGVGHQEGGIHGKGGGGGEQLAEHLCKGEELPLRLVAVGVGEEGAHDIGAEIT